MAGSQPSSTVLPLGGDGDDDDDDDDEASQLKHGDGVHVQMRVRGHRNEMALEERRQELRRRVVGAVDDQRRPSEIDERICRLSSGPDETTMRSAGAVLLSSMGPGNRRPRRGTSNAADHKWSKYRSPDDGLRRGRSPSHLPGIPVGALAAKGWSRPCASIGNPGWKNCPAL